MNYTLNCYAQILDWYQKNKPGKAYAEEENPGVQSVKKIFNYYEQHNYQIIVVGAFIRNAQLVHCDWEPRLLMLTIMDM